MSKVKIGVVGAGYWGPNLIRNFYEIPDADMKMVVELRQERRDHIHERYPEIHITADLNELLASDVEAVAISTSASTHYPLAKACLQAGKNVLVEKPMACCSDDARDLVNLGQQMGKVVMAGHTFVYNPAVVALKEIIESGEIGEVYYLNTTRVNLGLYQADVDVIWDLAPHDISIMLYVLGMEPVSASARGGMFAKAGKHDVAYITLYFPNGVMADSRVSWLDPCKIRRVTIVGSKKMIVYDDIEPVDKIKIYDKCVLVQPYSDTFEEFQLAYRYGDVVNYPLKWEEPLRTECSTFLEAVRYGTPTRSDGEQGLKVIRVLETAHNSLMNDHKEEKIEWE
jgi:predicted dehydrogenase